MMRGQRWVSGPWANSPLYFGFAVWFQESHLTSLGLGLPYLAEGACFEAQVRCTYAEDQPHEVASEWAPQELCPRAWSGAHPHLVSGRGFSVTSGGQSRIFKPVSIQTMW